tara:strand:+ start:509 stop:988 length:480 start_codon:yes stop_codon:yes gene_type:complete
MKIHKIIYIYVCFSLIIAQQKEEIEKPIFQWEYFTGSGDAIAQKLSLQWLENRRKEYIVKTVSVEEQPYSISFIEEILIRRYKSEDFITADYMITITNMNEQLVFTVTEVSIYLHDIITNAAVKKYELYELKKHLQGASKDLVEYIILSEKKFLQKLDE